MASLQIASAIIGMTADICILAITVFTLYLTVFSRKIKVSGLGCQYGTFFGDTIHFLIKNTSMHSIPVLNVFILKRIKGVFYQIQIKDYSDEPLIIDSWHIKNVVTDPFTAIIGWPPEIEDNRNWSELYKDSVLGIDVGNGIIWAKPYKKAPLRAARESFREHSFESLSVIRNSIDGRIISNAVSYVIRVISIDVNGNHKIETIFAIVGEEVTMLSGYIGEHNAIDSKNFNSPMTLKKYLCDTYKIPWMNIDVERVKRASHNS